MLKIPSSEYFAHPALGSTSIKNWAKSVAHGLNPQAIDPTAAAFGHAVHSLVLEGKSPIVQPSVDLRTKAGKEAREAFLATLPEDAVVVTEEAASAAINIQQCIGAYEPAAVLLDEGEPELSAFGTIDGVAVKGRADWVRGDILVDLKTVQDATFHGFQRAVVQYKYHAQASLYMHLFDAKEFFWICVEKKAPYVVSVFRATPPMLMAGSKIIQRGLNNYRAHQQNPFVNPNYYSNPIDLILPSWSDDDSSH